MTANPHEHYMIWVEDGIAENGNFTRNIKPVAADLSPDRKATLRVLRVEECAEETDEYIRKTRESMDNMCDVIIQTITSAFGEAPVPHFGFVDYVEQFQRAPHLLLANALAAIVASCAQEIVTSNTIVK